MVNFFKKKIIKPIITWVYKPFVKRKLRKPSNFTYQGISVEVWPGVFHPGKFYSSKCLADYLEHLDLQSKTVLELGCGTGFLSILAAKKGANMVASDISQLAINNSKLNAEKAGFKIDFYLSDLFDKIPKNEFDYILINPPFYRGKSNTEEESAWYAGPDFEYFHKLFGQIKGFTHSASQCVMILSDDCEMEKIKQIAFKNKYSLSILKQHRNWIETLSIYLLKPQQ